MTVITVIGKMVFLVFFLRYLIFPTDSLETNQREGGQCHEC
jgi:hypothetical protein